MSRAKYQILVIPFWIDRSSVKYCVFHRSDIDIWQFISGGGEDSDASPLDAAKREAFEEAGIPSDSFYVPLDTTCSISTECFPKMRPGWGVNCLVIPEYSFAVRVERPDITLSHEHTSCEWLDYENAKLRLRYDSNKVALWELSNKIHLSLICDKYKALSQKGYNQP